MLGIGLKLLSIGKVIREFFLANWRWLLPVLAAIAIVLYAWSWHKNAVEQAYADGVQYEHSLWVKKVDEENARNREFELVLRNVVEEYGNKAVQEASKRIEKETVHTNTIQTIIQQDTKYQTCQIDEKARQEINAIRELGPK